MVPAMRALVREVAPTFANALCAAPPDPPIDLAVARRQHAAYADALRACGLAVTSLRNADDPDGCFIEDTAVVARGVALITRPGAESRRRETVHTAIALRADVELFEMDAPATLDGGDCLRVGSTIFVGRSARTNDAGIARLAAVFEPHGFRVVAVAMPAQVLHLKCVCAPLGDDRITLADGSIPPDAFAGVSRVRIPEDESYAANCLAVGGKVLCAQGYPRTRDALAAAGFEPLALATSEFRKADGALTCLSILV
jgi:dimethylargininase